MSTRANLIINDEHDTIQLYRHSDGYPEGKYGVLEELKKALPFAWPTPRMEATDFAAAIVRAWKESGGNIHIDGIAELDITGRPRGGTLHGDIDYFYVITPSKAAEKWEVKTYDRDGALLSATFIE